MSRQKAIYERVRINPKPPESKLYTSPDGGSVRVTWSPINETWFLLWPSDAPVEEQQVLGLFKRWEEADREATRITSGAAGNVPAAENPIITAKYPGWCPKCGKKINIGDKIMWIKGEKPTHAVCPTGSPQQPSQQQQRAAPAPERRQAFPQSPPEPGAFQIQGDRSGRNDRSYDVGKTIHAPKVRDPGGGPDGHYYTVLASVLYPPNEDMGHYGWRERAWVRPATDAEAAPLAGRLTAKANREALVAELVAILRAGENLGDVAHPAGRVFTVNPGVHGSGQELAILGDDGAVYLWSSGHYDDYRRSCWVVRSARAVEIMQTLLG